MWHVNISIEAYDRRTMLPQHVLHTFNQLSNRGQVKKGNDPRGHELYNFRSILQLARPCFQTGLCIYIYRPICTADSIIIKKTTPRICDTCFVVEMSIFWNLLCARFYKRLRSIRIWGVIFLSINKYRQVSIKKNVSYTVIDLFCLSSVAGSSNYIQTQATYLQISFFLC